MPRRGYFLGDSTRSYDEDLEGMQRSAARTREQRRRQVATAQFDPAAFRRVLRAAWGARWAR